jgi:hypothetical protein
MFRKIFLLLIFTLCLVFKFFPEEVNTISRSILVLPFFNEDKKNKDFNYLSDVLKDSLISKLQTANQFIFIDNIDIKNKAKSMGYNMEELIDESKSIKLALELKADVLVLGKYVVLENKVLMYARAYDLLDYQDVVSSVDGDAGIDIFNLVDELSKDLARKMSDKYPKMNKNLNSDNIFMLNYAGIPLGTDYNKFMEMTNSLISYKIINKKENIIILKGYLTSAFKTKLILFKFDENKLTNMWILAAETKLQNKNSTLIEYKNKMIRIFGKEYESLENEEYHWNGNETCLDLIHRIINKKNNSYFLHYYIKDKKVNFEQIEEFISYFKSGIDISVGGGIVPVTIEMKMLGYKKLRYDQNDKPKDDQIDIKSSNIFQLGVFIPVSFTYYISNRASTGAAFKFGYYGAVTCHEFLNSPYYFSNTFSFYLAGRTKVLDRYNFDFRHIFEYGLLFNIDYVSKTNNNFINRGNGYYSENRVTTKNELYDQYGALFLGTGPVFSYGFEQRINNFSYEFLFFQGFTYGPEAFYSSSLAWYEEKLDTENNQTYKSGGLNFNIILGIEFRFNYYYFKKFK